jgi:tetratricopeptide repeat protein 30
MAHAKSLIGNLQPDSAEAIVAQGCILYKEEKYEQAKDKFNEALQISGY